MKLYYLKGACSLVPHVALEMIGAAYEVVPQSREFLKSPEYLALNPQGQIPLLIDGDVVLSQNIAILSYLNAIHPEAKLFGSETIAGKAQTMRWLAFLNADLHKAFSALFHLPNGLDESAKELLRQNARENILRMLAQCDEQLSQHAWLGEAFSVADIYLYVILRWCNGLQIEYQSLSHLPTFYQKVEAKPAVQTVLKVQGLL